MPKRLTMKIMRRTLPVEKRHSRAQKKYKPSKAKSKNPNVARKPAIWAGKQIEGRRLGLNSAGFQTCTRIVSFKKNSSRKMEADKNSALINPAALKLSLNRQSLQFFLSKSLQNCLFKSRQQCLSESDNRSLAKNVHCSWARIMLQSQTWIVV